MDFSKTGSIAEINHEIARLEEEKFITAREAEAVDAEAIDGLFRSAAGAAYARSEKYAQRVQILAAGRRG